MERPLGPKGERCLNRELHVESVKPVLREQHGAADVTKGGESCAASVWVSQKAFHAKGPAHHRERDVRRMDVVESVVGNSCAGLALGGEGAARHGGKEGLPPDSAGLLLITRDLKFWRRMRSQVPASSIKS